MQKFTKVAMLVVALFGLMAASASAADWHSNGSVAFTGTVAAVGGGASNNSILTIRPSGGGTAVVLGCTATSATGTLNASPAAGTNPWNNAASITPAFSGCKVAGTSFTVSCSAAALNTGTGPGAYSGPTTSPALGGVTTGGVSGVSCTLTLAGVACARVTGSLSGGTYTNPTATVAGLLTIASAGQSLTSVSSCPGIPSGSASFTNPSGGNLLVPVTTPSAPASQPRAWYGT